MQKLLLLIIALPLITIAKAQTPADTVLKKSPLKTMSDREYTAWINGEDLYQMGLAGELNGYPSPVKVIKYKTQLDLSPIQVSKLNAINKELHRKILEMGLIVIRNERTLDSIFKYHRLDNGSLIFYTNRYGLYQGELRNVYLQACLATRVLLSQQQIDGFEALKKRNK